MKTWLLIDGYNLMHAAGLARYGPQQLEKQRNRFLGFLSGHLYARERRLTCVVFDAFDAPDNLPRSSSLAEMEVQFADPGCDADSVLEELIARHSAPKQVCLISSDHRLQRAIQRRRGTPCDSDKFYRWLQQRGEVGQAGQAEVTPAEHAGKFGAEMGQAALETWLEEFGDLSLERIQQELLRNAQPRSFPPPALPPASPATPRPPQPSAKKPARARRKSKQGRKKGNSPARDRDAPLSPGEVERWMREFGFFSGPGELDQFDSPSGSGET